MLETSSLFTLKPLRCMVFKGSRAAPFFSFTTGYWFGAYGEVTTSYQEQWPNRAGRFLGGCTHNLDDIIVPGSLNFYT
jgi:hypothetical protein